VKILNRFFVLLDVEKNLAVILLDHSEKFKEVIAKSLEDINLPSDSTTIRSIGDCNSSLLELNSSDNYVDHGDVDAFIEEYRKKNQKICPTKMMESGWMTFDNHDS
jgi:hypothetical protein